MTSIKVGDMVKNIVIVGGGSAGWMTASYMSKKLSGINITLIESSDIPVIGVGESTVLPIVEFMNTLGLDEKDWMPKCNATYKSAIGFQGFGSKDDPPFWFPFTRIHMINGRQTSRYWMRKHFTESEYKDRFTLYDYCSAVPEICRQNRTVKGLQNYDYAYHFDAGLLGEYLKNYSKKNGVKHIVDNVTNVEISSNGTIESISRQNGERLRADLFIDCSGFSSLLLTKALKEPFESYSDYLFNDRAVAMRIPYEDHDREMFSYTMCTARTSGWIWKIPLYNRMGSGYVYSGSHLSEDQAEHEIRKFYGEKRVKDVDASHIKIRIGKQRRSWVKNCVAIGLSSGFIEPLESTGLFIVQGEVGLLTEILKQKNDYNIADMGIYNESVTRLMEVIRDFLVCHYALTGREDTEYWKDVKYTTKISDTLAMKLQIARTNFPDIEYVRHFDNPGLAGFTFSDGWQYILAGMNYLPFDYPQYRKNNVGPFEKHITDNMSLAMKYQEQMSVFKKRISEMPTHYQYLKDNIYNGK